MDKKIIELKPTGKKRLSINWLITKRCNLDCSYCFQNSDTRRTAKFDTHEQHKTAVDNIVGLGKTGMSLTVTGGEPTFQPEIVELLDYILAKKDAFRVVKVLSNFCMPMKIFENIAAKFQGVKKLEFLNSFHVEYANIEDVLAKFKLLRDAGLGKLVCMVLAHPDHIDTIRKMFYRMQEEGFITRVKVIMQKDPKTKKNIVYEQYSAEDRKWIKENAILGNEGRVELTWKEGSEITKQEVPLQELLFNDWHNFRGYMCEIPSRAISIIGGKAAYGTCHGRSHPVADFYKPGASHELDINKPIVCDKHGCNCVVDLVARKYLPGEIK